MKHLVATTIFFVTSVIFVHGQNPSLSAEDYSKRQIHLYVSPQGNDAWPESQKQPKASLKGARDAVRQLKSGGGLTGPVHVRFADGEYPLMEPVTFTPQDNGSETTPVIYEAMQGTRPVFSGGRRITGFRPGDNGLWVAEVPGVTSGQWYFEQLWVEAVVMLDGARNIIFQDFEIEHAGIYGMWFRKDCSQCRVERSLFRDLGAGGIRIGEPSVKSNTAEHTHPIILDNNIIQTGGRIFSDETIKKTGFKPFDYSKAGVYGIEWKAVAAGAQ